jgi:hypothetical protein
MIEIVRAHARNVKRWKDGDMRLRWAAAGMLEASTQFRRVKGYHQLPKLAVALRRGVGVDDPSTLAVTASPYDPSGGRREVPRPASHPRPDRSEP